jgi:hypothetical protein
MNGWQMKANREWANRPQDERFTSLTELHAHCTTLREQSRAKAVSSRGIQCAPYDNDSRALVCTGPNGGAVALTHWSFGQLAQRAAAPSGYLRTLPAAMAADCINYGLQTRDVEDLGVLLYKPDSGLPTLRAATGPNYGRIWNATITRALVDRFGDGITGDFRVPGEFGKAVTVTKENTTLYASDRDMFVFLADEQHRISIPNRRDGRAGDMARGFFVWNSEVGSATLGIATFLFDYVCCNRIVWGGTQYREVRIRHTAGAPDRWLEDVAPAIESYAHGSAQSVVKAIEDARAKRIGDDAAVTEFLARRFTRSQVSAIKAAHMADEQRPIESLWDAATGATAYARSITHQDARVDIEREAGKILDLAA